MGTAVRATGVHDCGEGTVLSAQRHLERSSRKSFGPEGICASGPEAGITTERFLSFLGTFLPLEELMGVQKP